MKNLYSKKFLNIKKVTISALFFVTILFLSLSFLAKSSNLLTTNNQLQPNSLCCAYNASLFVSKTLSKTHNPNLAIENMPGICNQNSAFINKPAICNPNLAFENKPEICNQNSAFINKPETNISNLSIINKTEISNLNLTLTNKSENSNSNLSPINKSENSNSNLSPINKSEPKNHLVSSNATITSYAKVKENCLLFKTPDANNLQFSNVYFEIPETYFVTILSKVDNSTLKVRYGNTVGYAKIESLSMVNFTPKECTLSDIYFNISPDAGTQIRTAPDASDNSNILTTIPANAQSLKYIAKLNATIPNGGISDVWYYAEYTPVSNPTSVYTGYVYVERTSNLTNIPINLETEIIAPPINQSPDLQDDEMVTISPTLKVVLISLICLPILIIFISILIKHKNAKRQQQSQNPSLSLQNTHVQPKEQNQKYSDTFLGAKSQIGSAEQSSKPKTLRAFKDKQYTKADNFKQTLQSISSKNCSNKNCHINLDILDEDDEELL